MSKHDEEQGLLLNYDRRDEIIEEEDPDSALAHRPTAYNEPSTDTEPLLGGLNQSSSQKPEPSPTRRGSDRLLSLDIFRGCTIMWMIFVDNQGGLRFPSDVSWAFTESNWDGVHMSDWVFPSFIFIAGTAIYLASKAHLNDRACSWKVWFRVLRRWVILFLVGFMLNLIASKFNFGRVRIMGILQRIGTCYVITASTLLLFPVWFQWLLMATFYAVYIGVMYGVNVPSYTDSANNFWECGRGNLTEQCNAAGWIDRGIMGPHMMLPTDPEGIFTTIPATVTMWFGLEFGRLRSCMVRAEVLWFGLTAALLLSGGILNFWYPFNKKIWSFSFTLFVSGFGGAVLGFLYFFLDVWAPVIKETRPFSWLCNAFFVLGTNPIIIFVGMIFLEIVLLDLAFLPSGESAWTFIYEQGFASWVKDRQFASFVFSVPHLLLWWLLAAFLYKKRWFLKI